MNINNKSLKCNVIMNAILTMSSFVFPLITFPYVSRILYPEGIGKVSFATSFMAYFLMFAQFGTPTYGIRACARVRDNKQELTRTAQELLIINLVMGVLSYVALWGAFLLIPRLQRDSMLYFVISLNIFFNAIGMEWLYKALEQYTYITIRSILFKVVSIVAMFAWVRTKDDYIIYGGITILAASASNVFNFFYSRKYISLRPIGGYRFRLHLRASLVFFAMACATTVYTNMDTVMLGFTTSDATVGCYDAAVRIKNVLVSIVASLGAVLLPRASYYIERGENARFHQIVKKALNFVFLAAPPLIVYFVVFARQSILFLSGEAYAGAIVPMRIVMPTLLVIGLSNILGIQMLVPMGKESVVLQSTITGAVVDVACNLVLVPLFGAAGAATSNLAAECAVLLVQYSSLRNDIRPALVSIQYWKILLGVTVGAVASFWIVGLSINPFAALVISAVIFFGVYGIVLLVTREPLVWESVRQVLEKIKKYLLPES